VRVRAASATDADVLVLREMLGWAARWRLVELEDSAILDRSISLYVEGWGRPGDAGVIAENEQGSRIGAAWYRRFTQAEHGYGFIAPEVPEISIGVAPEHRSRGVGTALLKALVERAQREGMPALSLSVEEENPALRLYERLGFRRVGRVGGAWTMRRELL
jgi:ribosomal protein S18 acetylase RimI-like enzyme